MLRSDEILTLASSLAAILFIGATAFMPPEVYASGWWFGFWAVVAAGIVCAILRKRLWRKPAVFSLHFAFLLILGGGAATALFAERGSLHLHKGQTKHSFVAPDGIIKNLPLALTRFLRA